MKRQILSISGRVLYECEAPTQRDAILEAIKNGAYLRGAYLGEATRTADNENPSREAEVLGCQFRL